MDERFTDAKLKSRIGLIVTFGGRRVSTPASPLDEISAGAMGIAQA